MKVERPPEIWEGDTEDVRFLPLLGEMIASGLAKSAQLADLTLSVSNVVVERAEDDDEPLLSPEPGEYVAVTVLGAGDWGPEGVWPRSQYSSPSPWLERMNDRLRTAGVPFAYVRTFKDYATVTIFLRRV